MSNLVDNDGAAWVLQNIDTIWNVCRTDWTTCRNRVHHPTATWDLNDTMGASMYEAYRVVYRSMLTYQRAGVAIVVGQFNGGGRLTSSDGSELSLDVVDARWDRGSYEVTTKWTLHDATFAIGISVSLCVLVCIRGGVFVGSDGVNFHGGFGGAGLGLAVTGDVVPFAGACSQQGAGAGFGGGAGVVGSVSVSGSIDSGFAPESVALSGGFGFLQQLPSAVIFGGGSYTWMAGC